MNRELTSHKVNGLSEAIVIKVLDEPGQGGACHRYRLSAPPLPDSQGIVDTRNVPGCEIEFQNGPIAEAGVNGLSNEALLAIVEDRLIGFQFGDFVCIENELALRKLQEAMMWLHKRTRGRMDRGVEGTHEK